MKKHIIFATTVILMVAATYIGTHPKQTAEAVMLGVPVPEIEATYLQPNPWAADLTEGVQTSAQYGIQQSAMRTVLIDGHAIDDYCITAQQRGMGGVAVPAERLACVHPEIWQQQSLETYYILAHELAHIALSEYGRELNDEAHSHRDEHFVLTIHIMDELMEKQGVSTPVRFVSTKMVSMKRGACKKSAHC